MLAGLTKAFRSQSLLRLLGLQAPVEETSQPQSACSPEKGHPSARDFILMAQAAQTRPPGSLKR